ncbi:MAG: SpoIID/LytB domain-containing protein [Oscillibacter sp.]|nr:SpoIID/LytB domain-containing protein [Oscillibacter sp.]
MKKKLIMLLFVVTFFTFGAVNASAVENDMVKVGLRYGSSALFSANLENAIGEGYEFGWFDEDREFTAIGETDEIAISMTAAGTIYMNSSGIYSAEEPSGKSKVMGQWHIQVEGFEDFEEAQDFAWDYDGYPAYIDGEYVVRIGCFESKSEAQEELERLDYLDLEDEEEEEPVEDEPVEDEPVEDEPAQEDVTQEEAPTEEETPPEEEAPPEEDPSVEEAPTEDEGADEVDPTEGETGEEPTGEELEVATYSRSSMDHLDYSIVKSSSTGVIVTVTKTTDILFEFDCSGIYDFGVLPIPEERGEETSTWFKGYKYPGGFSYPRVTGGDLNVINVVDLEEYVKGVIPYEMSGSWPIEALKAQAVCARTYVCKSVKHLSSYGFDVCNTTCCQVYYGRGSGVLYPSENSDKAVEKTAGKCLYYDGELVQDAVYHSSDGGATEDAYYVWGSERGYLIGKEDPYEAEITIPNYEYSVTYTASELTYILKNKGYKVGTVKNVYVSEYTPMGNVYKVTFEGSSGKVTVKGDTCRTIFSSATYNKYVKSLRFEINGGGSTKKTVYYVNGDGDTLETLEDVYVLSGDGDVTTLDGGDLYVITADGTETVSGGTVTSSSSSNKSGNFTITGTGWGHNVGMSQYGAKAMAELECDYKEILQFYYTDVKIK